MPNVTLAECIIGNRSVNPAAALDNNMKKNPFARLVDLVTPYIPATIAAVIPVDKILHFAVGLLLAILAAAISPSIWFALLLVLALAVAKEYYDLHQGREFSLADCLATVAGGVVVCLFRFLI